MSMLPTYGLTWDQARSLSTFIRRESWSTWIAYSNKLWNEYDSNQNFLRVVTGTDFQASDYKASDWTTDPVGTKRDVCTLPAPVRPFSPPSISVEIDLSAGIIVTLGPSVPSGSYQLRVYLNAGLVAYVEATDNSTTTIPCAFPTSGTIYANVGVISRLPLPSWSGIGTAEYSYPPIIGFSVTRAFEGNTITLAEGSAATHSSLFYNESFSGTSAGVTVHNPFSSPVTLTVDGTNPLEYLEGVYDDVLFNGAVYQPDAFVAYPGNPVGSRNGYHRFLYTTIIAPGSSILIQGRDNGSGGWMYYTLSVSW